MTTINGQPAASPAPAGALNATLTLLDASGANLGTLTLPVGGGEVGRDGSCWLPITNDRVAPQHLWLDWDGHQASVTDLSGDGATALAGIALTPYEPTPWAPGVALTFADFALRLAVQEPPAELKAELDNPYLRLLPGEPVTVRLFLENTSVVEQSALVSVEGALDRFVRLPAAPITLPPGERVTVPLEIAPMRGSGLQAGPYEVAVRVETERNSATAAATWTVPAVAGLSLSLGPDDYAAAYEQSTFTVSVRNEGNTPLLAALTFSSVEGLSGTLRPAEVEVDPGQEESAELRVQARRRMVGDPQQRGFQVRAATSEGVMANVEGSFTQEPIFSVWLAGIAGLATLLLLAFFASSLLSNQATQAAGPAAGAGDSQSLGTAQAQVNGAFATAAAAETGQALAMTSAATDPSSPAQQTSIANAGFVNQTAQANLRDAFRLGTTEAERATTFALDVTAAAEQTGTAIAAEGTARSEAQTIEASRQVPPSTQSISPTRNTPSATPTLVPAITAIKLSKAEIDENQPPGTIIGTLLAEGPRTSGVQYSLVADDADNRKFRISGVSLLAAESFDHEAAAELTIRVRADAGGSNGSREEVLTVKVNDLNEPPEITLVSQPRVLENLPAGTLVSLVSVKDPDPGDSVTLSLSQNNLFELAGDKLQTKVQFDYESQPPSGDLTLEITARDSGTPPQETKVSVTVLIENVNEPPSDITFTSDEFAENSTNQSLQLNATDPDGAQQFTFAAASGTGDTGLFDISGAGVVTPKPSTRINFEQRNSYTIRVRVTDNGAPPLSFEKDLPIRIRNTNDAPVANNDSYQGREDTVLTIAAKGVRGNDTDEDCSDIDQDCNPDVSDPNPLAVSGVAGGSVDSEIRLPGTNGSGTLRMRSDGGFTFTPDENVNGSFSFEYTITDQGTSIRATVQLSIAPVPDALVAPDYGTLTITETDTLDLNVNATDPDNNNSSSGLNITKINDTSISSQNPIVINQGTTAALEVKVEGLKLILKPTRRAFGNLSFSYTVTGPGGRESTGRISVFIQRVNTPPVAQADTGQVNEDRDNGNQFILLPAPGILGNDRDADGDGIRVTAVRLCDQGTPSNLTGDSVSLPGGNNRFTVVVFRDGKVELTLGKDYNSAWPGQTSSTCPESQIRLFYQVSDGNDSSEEAGVAITVNAVNDPPEFSLPESLSLSTNPGAQTVDITGISVGPSTAQDENATQGITSVQVSSNAGGIVPNPTVTYPFNNDPTRAQISFIPPPTASGDAILTVTVRDNGPGNGPNNNESQKRIRVCINLTNCPSAASPITTASASRDAHLRLHLAQSVTAHVWRRHDEEELNFK